MPKQKVKQAKQKESVSEEEQADYDSEEMQDVSDEEMSSDEAGDIGDSQMREVDSKNVLNYQTDSDEDGDGSSDDLGANLAKQKEELQMADGAWGKKKKNYYKDDSDSDEGSEDEAELATEAMRL